jgi:hypothetical protein
VIPLDQITPFLPLAHLGHWYFIPLYVAPAALILISAIRATLKERRKAREESSEPKTLR